MNGIYPADWRRGARIGQINGINPVDCGDGAGIGQMNGINPADWRRIMSKPMHSHSHLPLNL